MVAMLTSVDKPRSASDALVQRHMPLAKKLAWRYAGRGEPYEDLVQVASVGLLNAARRYDGSRGAGFETFATTTIDGELKRHFRDRCWGVHVPRDTKDRALKVTKVIRKELEHSGVAPTVSELAQRLQLCDRDVIEALEAGAAFCPRSLDAPALTHDTADSPALGDTIGCVERGYERVEDRLTRTAVMRRLSPLEHRIMYLRYLEDRSQHDVAARVGVSQAHVSRVLLRIATALRQAADRSATDRSPEPSAPPAAIAA